MESNSQNEKPQPVKNPEKKGTPLGNNVVWYLLAIGVTVLFIVGWLHQDASYDLKRSELERLVKASGPKTKNEGIIVRDAAAHEEVQYKNPTEIVLSPVEITGKVERRVISQAAKGTESTATEPSAARSTPQLVTFQTPLNPTTGNEEFWSKLFREQELD